MPEITLRRVILTIIVCASLFGFVYAFTIGGGGRGDIQLQADAVEVQSPTPNAQSVPRQSTISIDLRSGWTGRLTVDGQRIPETELNCLGAECERPLCPPGVVSPPEGCRQLDDPQNRVYYAPGDGKTVESLGPGRRCALARIWRIETETEAQGRDVSWCFRVV
jgi:hypothetical protein